MAKYKVPKPKPMFVLNGADFSDLSKQIREVEKDFRVREVDLTFKEERLIYSAITSSGNAAKFVRDVIGDGMEIQEHFVVLYMNHANKVIGYYKHTKGTINSTQVDVEMIVAVGLKALAKSVILSHNHPSGINSPSQQDKNLTEKIKTAFKYFDVSVLDHIIVTKDDYYSFADNADSALSGIHGKETSGAEQALRAEILKQLKKVTRVNSPQIWERIQTQEGYAKIEAQIIGRVIRQHLVPAAIIPQIETEYDMM